MTPIVIPPVQGAMADPHVDFPARLVIQSDLGETRRVQEQVEAALLAQQFAETEIFGIRLALEEALVNAIKHGNQLDPAKKVRVSWRVTTERFDIAITDEGPGFDPADLPDPTDPENIERQCGRGVFLMKHFMTEVAYNGRGNSVIMAKTRKPD
jgi:serine/threonine-protein kinase RsbW